MAKSQKKSNREIRKPKQAKATPAPTTSVSMGSTKGKPGARPGK